jgi:PAS domain S-box-containing protein
VWVPECSGGEDAYSVAISIFEAFGSRWREIPLCVFSTHSDEDLVSRARGGRFPLAAAKAIPEAALERFFVQGANGISVRPFVRSACRFARHDHPQTPPFSRMDLIVCRETLAALPPAARADALRTYHSTLIPGGVLLDQSGTAGQAHALFSPMGRGRSYAAKKISANPLSPAAGLKGRNASIIDSRLQESEERFQVLFSKADHAILVRDTESGLILEANESAARLYGWSLTELVGKRGEDLVAAPEALRRRKGERRSQDRLSLPHGRRKDGTFFPVDDNTTFLMRKGRPCTLWMVRDATARMKLAARQTHDDAQDAFLGDVVHELRSPISIIQGSVETLRQGVRGTLARAKFFEFIENHTTRMARLVDQLLDLSVADSLKRKVSPSRVLIAEAIWEIAAAFIPAAKRRGISIKIDIPWGLAVVADPAGLPHVFGNLLNNAIKFTPRGGKVTVCGRVEGGEGILSVKDTGSGIPAGDLSRIFERFFRSGNARGTKGTGLGLAIVLGIVKANHGRVFAQNDSAGGAVFHVALPLAPPAA